jgi:competence protein ComEA
LGSARVGLVIAAIVAALLAVFALFRAFDERSAPPIVIENAAATLPIVVEVRGAVVAPGVYELAPQARMQDALNAAGGLSEIADLSTINRARRLRDGEVVIVPELPIAGGTPQTAGDPTLPSSENANGKINLNSASASQLEALPGIGEVTAQRIVDFREEHGPFRAVDELVHVQGISARTIDQLRDLVTVGP